jgi:hypothetical protein
MQLLLNLAIAETVGQRQNQASAEDVTRGQTARLRPLRQLVAFEGRKNEQVSILCHAHLM